MDLQRWVIADQDDQRPGLHVADALVRLVGLECSLTSRIALPQAQLDVTATGHDAGSGGGGHLGVVLPCRLLSWHAHRKFGLNPSLRGTKGLPNTPGGRADDA